ncbi:MULTISPECIES: GGDEF domain-containing protein [unclassified Crossiella]|uniref:diguanylate cyclase domain-containing protein n=1 Tax=unclassified Crossiella TaxID=2620835 RepID=UPI00200035B4|nr:MULTISPECIES: GGDEF domain-containing protein [unclassified Crossiella]MCK2241217.1 diguanylate cyclase [Crossiella sp. S99.2]MCK2253639.1 diguanylate cyclase [Crossiella sp. S99.1]
MAALGAERAKNGKAGTLVVSAWQLRWRAPELSRLLSERAAELAVADGDEHTRLRAETLTLFALNRLGQGVVVAERAVASLRAAEAMDETELAWRLRVELANAARVVGAPLTGFAVLRPVLEAGTAPRSLRAAAMVQLVDCLAHLGSVPELAEALAEADQLYGEDPDLEPDVVLVLRGLLHSVASAHHRRWGDLPAAVHAAREGLALLDQLADPAADSGHARARLILQLVCALLDSNRPGEARSAAHDLLDQPVRAPVASSAGWIRLALATRHYLPSGQPDTAAELLGATADSAQRHGLEPLLAESLTALSHVHEMGGDYADALSCLRTAYAAERRRQRAVHRVRVALIEQIPVPQLQGETAAGLREQVTAMLRRGRVRRDTPRGAVPMLRRTAAEIDDLTGLLNQSGFRRRLDDVVNGGDPGHALALVLFDVGKLDDTAPHHVSEQLLRTVADRVRDTAPQQAAVARVGGEELAVLLPGATQDQAQRWAEQLRTEVAGLSPALPVTVNTGVAQHRPGTRADVLITEADRALARAKHATTPPRFRATDLPPPTESRAARRANTTNADTPHPTFATHPPTPSAGFAPPNPSQHATPPTEFDPPAPTPHRATATGEFTAPRPPDFEAPATHAAAQPAPSTTANHHSAGTGEFELPSTPPGSRTTETGEFATPGAPPGSRTTETGEFAMPSPPSARRTTETGEFATPNPNPGRRPGETGELPASNPTPSRRTAENSDFAASNAAPSRRAAETGEFAMPSATPSRRAAGTGEFEVPSAPSGRRTTETGEFAAPNATPSRRATETGEFEVPTPATRRSAEAPDFEPSNATSGHHPAGPAEFDTPSPVTGYPAPGPRPSAPTDFTATNPATANTPHTTGAFPAPPHPATEQPSAEATSGHTRSEATGRRAAPEHEARFAALPPSEPAPLGQSEQPLFFEAPTAPQPIITDQTPRPPELDAASLTGLRPVVAEPVAPPADFASVRAATADYQAQPAVPVEEPASAPEPEPAPEPVAVEPEPVAVEPPVVEEPAPAPGPRVRRRSSLAEALDFDWSQALRDTESDGGYEPALPPPPRPAEAPDPQPVTHHTPDHEPVKHHASDPGPVAHHAPEHEPVSHHAPDHGPVAHDEPDHQPSAHRDLDHRPVVHQEQDHRPVAHHESDHRPATHDELDHQPVVHHEFAQPEARHPDLAPRESARPEPAQPEAAQPHPDLAPRDLEPAPQPPAWTDLQHADAQHADAQHTETHPSDTHHTDQLERRSRGDAKLAELLAEALAAYETGRREDPGTDYADQSPAPADTEPPAAEHSHGFTVDGVPAPGYQPATPEPAHPAEPGYSADPAGYPAYTENSADPVESGYGHDPAPPAEPRYGHSSAESGYDQDTAHPAEPGYGTPPGPADFSYDPVVPARPSSPADPVYPPAVVVEPMNPADLLRNEVTFHRAEPRSAEVSGFHPPIQPSAGAEDDGPFTGRCGPQITGEPDPFAAPDPDPFGYARAMDATANASMLPEPPRYPDVEDPTEPQPRVVDVPREQAWTPPNRDPSFG